MSKKSWELKTYSARFSILLCYKTAALHKIKQKQKMLIIKVTNVGLFYLNPLALANSADR